MPNNKTRKLSASKKTAYKNNWRTRSNKQRGPQRLVSPLHPAHKAVSKKPAKKVWNSNSNNDGRPDY